MMEQDLQKEIRIVSTQIQLRSIEEDDNQQESIEGYALKFDKWSDTIGYYFPMREKLILMLLIIVICQML